MLAMHNSSPRKRHQEKVLTALDHIHGWGCSTTSITARACRTKSAGFITAMAKAGLVRYETVFGRKFLLLTRKGLEFLRSSIDPADQIATERAALKLTHVVNLFAHQHDEYVQEVIADWRARCWEPHWWLPERQLRARLAGRLEDGGKVPDGCFASDKGVVFLEAERTKKSRKEIEIMLLNVTRLIENRPTHRVEVHFLRNISALYRDVYSSWLADGIFRFYTLGTDGAMHLSGTGTITPSMREALGRISFVTVRI